MVTGLIPTTQAGRALGCTGQTVRRLIASGQLRGQKIGDRWLVDGASVATLERQQGAGS